MKKQYRITKIGNSLFATLPNKLAKLLGLKSGDKVIYEVVADKKQILMRIRSSKKELSLGILKKLLNEKDKEWLDETSGSLK